MKRVLLFLLPFLLVAQLSFAFNFDVEESVSVPLGASEKLSIEINNSLNITDTFNIVISGQKPWMTLSPTMIALDASSSGTVNLYLAPYSTTPLGLYKLKLRIESMNTGEVKEKDIYVSVIRGEITRIEKIVIKGDLEPTGNITAEIHIKNYGTTTMQNIILNATVRSQLKNIADFSAVMERLDPDETKTVNRTFSLPEYAESGEYRIEVELSYNGRVIKTEKKFSVAEKAVIEKDSEDVFMVFGSGKKIIVKNYGNADGDAEITQNFSSFESLFFSGNPTSIEGDTYKWTFSIKPGEEKTVEYKIDYLPLFLVFVVVVVLVWFFLFKIRTIKIRKHIMQKKVIEEGEEFTVGLDVKNFTGSQLNDVVIKDFVPPVFSVKDTEGPKPTKRVTKMGTELTWKIKEFAKKEERVLTYKIIPMFGVKGQAKLPRAISRFNIKDKAMQSNSNIAMLGIKVEEE